MTTLAKYTYLGLSSVVQVDYAEPEVRYDLITNSTSNNPYGGLDRFGRVVDLLWEKYSGTPADLVHLEYGYDKHSNRLWREDVVAQSYSKDFDELYAYDGMHRLADMQRGKLNTGHTAIESGTLEFQQDWSLDATGNWSEFDEDATGSGSWSLEQTRTHNTVNEITNITETTGPAWITPQHDRNGNMTLMPQPADPTEDFTATYDAWNRLVKLVDDTTTVAEYIYDGMNWRTRKILPAESRHYYYSSAWQVLEERIDFSTDPSQQYVWGLRYIDDLILRDRDTDANGTLNERLYGMQDANWNVVAICDEVAIVEERFSYSAYGIPIFIDENFVKHALSARLWNILYTGRHFDSYSYLLNYRNRSYHPAIGKFLSRDIIPSVNLYRYTNSNPISYTDPAGLMPNRADAITLQDLLTTVESIEDTHPNKTCFEILILVRDSVKWRRKWVSNHGGSLGSGSLGSASPGGEPGSGSVSRSPSDSPPSPTDQELFMNDIGWKYIYTTKHGWIDLGHFFEAARFASKPLITKRLVKTYGYWVEIQQYFAGSLSPSTEGLLSSAWTQEDLPSNGLGAEFGDLLYDTYDCNCKLSVELKAFFNSVGAVAPTSAPDWNTLPANEEEWDKIMSVQRRAMRQLEVETRQAEDLSEIPAWVPF